MNTEPVCNCMLCTALKEAHNSKHENFLLLDFCCLEEIGLGSFGNKQEDFRDAADAFFSSQYIAHRVLSIG